MIEPENDILFEIDMKLHDEFNDKFCEMNDNFGTFYTYKDIMDLEEEETYRERQLLREAIIKQSKQIKKFKEDIEKLKKDIIFLRKELYYD